MKLTFCDKERNNKISTHKQLLKRETEPQHINERLNLDTLTQYTTYYLINPADK